MGLSQPAGEGVMRCVSETGVLRRYGGGIVMREHDLHCVGDNIESEDR